MHIGKKNKVLKQKEWILIKNCSPINPVQTFTISIVKVKLTSMHAEKETQQEQTHYSWDESN